MKIYTELKENERRFVEDYVWDEKGTLAVFSTIPNGWEVIESISDDIFVISNGNKSNSAEQNEAILKLDFYDYIIAESLFCGLDTEEECCECHDYICSLYEKADILIGNYRRAEKMGFPKEALAKKREAIAKMISCYNLSAAFFNYEVEEHFELFDLLLVDAA